MELKSLARMGAMALILAIPAKALLGDDAEAMMKASDCFSCHAVGRKVVGPAYLDVAKKYKGAGAAQIKVLVGKVKNGGSGNWGAVPMAGHPTLAEADIEKMVKWVLSQTPASVAAANAAAAKAAAAAAKAAPAAAPAASATAAEPKKAKKKHHSHLRSEEHEEELAFENDEQVRLLMEKQDCYGCHSGTRRDGMAEDMPWPSFAKMEGKLKGKDLKAVVKKIHAGEGALSWGKLPHPTYGHLPEEAVEKMVAYVAEGKSTKGVVAKDPNSMSAEEWMRKGSDCFSCHSVANKVVGPAYKDVAKKYAGAGAGQIKALVKKIKEGGSGVWGSVPMAAHPAASDSQLEKAVRWVLEQK
jgi:cytochrome c